MKATHSNPWHRAYRRNTGLSLIELLVSMAIGLIVTLAITTVMVSSEKQQRTSTSANDATQAGAFASLTLDRAIRSAGAGFTQFQPALGCLLNAGIGPTQILPPPAPLPAPFDTTIGTAAAPVVLAPAVIVDGGTNSDQLIVMSGTHGFSEIPRTITPGSVTVSSVNVGSTMGIVEGDLVLVAGNVAGGACMVQQVGAVTAGSVQLPFAGSYFDSVGATTQLLNFGTNAALATRASVIPIGSMGIAGVRPPNPPSMFAYGVDGTGNLVAYDLLNTTGATPVSIAEGVVSMKARYGTGLATPAAGGTPVTPVPLTWTLPTATNYNATSTELLGAAGQARLPTIQAIRVSLVMRSAQREKDLVYTGTSTNLVHFPDLPAGSQATVAIAGDDRYYRYRIIDTVIPLRNF